MPAIPKLKKQNGSVDQRANKSKLNAQKARQRVLDLIQAGKASMKNQEGGEDTDDEVFEVEMSEEETEQAPIKTKKIVKPTDDYKQKFEDMETKFNNLQSQKQESKQEQKPQAVKATEPVRYEQPVRVLTEEERMIQALRSKILGV